MADLNQSCSPPTRDFPADLPNWPTEADKLEDLHPPVEIHAFNAACMVLTCLLRLKSHRR
jgi:hypothetical protein